jgi:predicted transcriptional regulator
VIFLNSKLLSFNPESLHNFLSTLENPSFLNNTEYGNIEMDHLLKEVADLQSRIEELTEEMNQKEDNLHDLTVRLVVLNYEILELNRQTLDD